MIDLKQHMLGLQFMGAVKLFDEKSHCRMTNIVQ